MIVYFLFLAALTIFFILDKTSMHLYSIVPSIRSSEAEKYSLFNHSEVNTSNGIFLNFALGLSFMFTAFRFDVGWDYMAYYNTIEHNLKTNIVGNQEFLNNMMVEVSRQLRTTNFYFFVSSLIIFYFIIITVKRYSRDVWMSFIFFMSFPLFYLNSLSVIRTFMALAISFYAFKYLLNKQPLRYFIVVILASFFHTSALIALLFYFGQYIKITPPRMMVILLSSPLISFLMERITKLYFPRYLGYLNETSNQEGTKAIFVFIAIGVVGLIFRNRIIEKDEIASIYFNLFYIGLGLYLIFFRQGTLGHRLSLYGTIYSLLLVPKIVSLFPNKKDNLLIEILVYSVCIVMFVYTIYISSSTFIPYQTIWH